MTTEVKSKYRIRLEKDLAAFMYRRSKDLDEVIAGPEDYEEMASDLLEYVDEHMMNNIEEIFGP